jgi:carbon storage regulator
VLIIRRRAGEAIVIGGEIEVTITEISPARVKLAIGAPREVSIVRKEAAAVAMNNRRAAQLVAGPAVQEVLRLLGRGSPKGGTEDALSQQAVSNKPDSGR